MDWECAYFSISEYQSRMEKEKPRLARLTAIITQLQSKRIVTATELAEKHRVSVRTVYRDIRTLEKSGIPIFPVEGKGYSLVEGYQLPPIMFTEEEANALITAERLVEKDRDRSLTEQYQSAITKIKSVMRFSQKEKAELLLDRIQVRNNRENEKTSSHLMQLQSAIANFQLVKIDYLSLEKRRSQREIEPFALYTTQNNWVLIAFCRLRTEFRAFRLDCIERLDLLPGHFEPHRMTLQEYLDQCRENYSQHP